MDKAKDFEKSWEDYKANKQKQIEEMARIISPCSKLNCDDCVKTKRTCIDYFIVQKLYNAGYRKIPENVVVIDKNEYDKLRLLADECIDWRRKNCNVGELPKENAVVLTAEQFSDYLTLKASHTNAVERCEKLQADNERLYKNIGNFKDVVRKETAEKFARLVEFHSVSTRDENGHELFSISALCLKEILHEEFGISYDEIYKGIAENKG